VQVAVNIHKKNSRISKASMNQSNLALIVPTYDRPELLERTLSFVRRLSDMPIIVADGSSGSISHKNSDICKRVGHNIKYFCQPVVEDSIGKTNNYRARLLEAVNRVETPYVTMCADDDLILPGFAQRCVEFLNDNPDYIACHGSYVGFTKSALGFNINAIVYHGPSIDGSEVATRLMQLYSNYEATFYAVYRTEAQRKIIECMPSDLERFLMLETTQSAATAIIGKVKRLEGIYYLRNLGVPPHARDVEGWNQWMAQDFPEFYACFTKHRERMLALASRQAGETFDALRTARAFDMMFLLYVGREFHPGFWLDEYLRTLIDDEGERNGMRLRLEVAKPQLRPHPVGVADQIRSAVKRVTGRLAGEIGLARLNRIRKFLVGAKPSGHGIGITQRFPHVGVSPAVWGHFLVADWEEIGPLLTQFVEQWPVD
jgi:glycosyltransferase domain-containing protein